MASKPEAEAMQELASMLWSRFLKERVREELNHELNAYKAEVVTNNGDGTLTVRRPFESVTPTLKAAPSLAYAQPGDMVMVAGIGDKSKALSNAFVLAKADLSDDTSVPVYGQGDNLLDNWYFIGGGSQQGGSQFPINQRLQTSYSNGYGIDRWIVRNANMTMAVEANGLKLSYSSGSYADFYQLIGSNRLANLAGKTVTFSILDNNGIHAKTFVWDSSGSGSDKGYLANDIRLYAGGTTSSYINLVLRVYINNYSLRAVKLELGDKQTLAHKENGTWVLNTIPSYEEQRVKCLTSTADSADAYANKTLATEQQIAYVENGLTASRAYAKGEYFCWNGLLYRTTAAISSGQTFTAQNCAQVPEGGFNHLKPLDISTAITAFSNRLTNVTVKAWFYPSNRKIELSAYGEAATTLSATQNTLFTTSTAYAPSGMTFAGCAVKKQTDIVAVWENSTLINVQHGGLARGDSISVNLSWYI